VKPLALVMLLTVLGHAGFVGSRITVSLFAIHQGASPLTVGVLLSLYSVVGLLFAVHAGRLIDRVGTQRPLVWSGAAVAGGILLPFLWPELWALYIAATVIGAAFLFQHIALNHVVGMMGTPADRAVNFSWFALGYAISGFFGPLLAGFGIDMLGHRYAFLLCAIFPAAGALILAWKRPGSATGHEREMGDRSVLDLVRDPRLRPAFIFSGLLATGWDIYAFVMPIHGTRIGLSASTIGIVMSTFALATFVVRLGMPMLSRRLREWTVVTAALVIAGSAYSLFAWVERVPLLMAISFLLGLGLGSAQPMIMALLYSASPPGRQGEVVGIRTTMLNASHTFLPLVFGGLGAALGMMPVFLTMAGSLLAGGWLASRQHRDAGKS